MYIFFFFLVRVFKWLKNLTNLDYLIQTIQVGLDKF